jgi:hypothetical protein
MFILSQKTSIRISAVISAQLPGFASLSCCYASKDTSRCCEEGLRISIVIDDYEDRLVADWLLISK